MHNISDPERIKRGNDPVASLEWKLATQNPSRYARILSDEALFGFYRSADIGKKVSQSLLR